MQNYTHWHFYGAVCTAAGRAAPQAWAHERQAQALSEQGSPHPCSPLQQPHLFHLGESFTKMWAEMLGD